MSNVRRPSNTLDLSITHLHHFVGPRNVEELDAIHGSAKHTATFYISTILTLYVIGLVLILIHYMNSYYGSWNWSIFDVWTELKPSFFCLKSSTTTTPDTENASLTPNKGQKASNGLGRDSSSVRSKAKGVYLAVEDEEAKGSSTATSMVCSGTQMSPKKVTVHVNSTNKDNGGQLVSAL